MIPKIETRNSMAEAQSSYGALDLERCRFPGLKIETEVPRHVSTVPRLSREKADSTVVV